MHKSFSKLKSNKISTLTLKMTSDDENTQEEKCGQYLESNIDICVKRQKKIMKND